MPDEIELQNKYLMLEDEYNKLVEEHNNTIEENARLKKDKEDLQRHNQELFIRCTSPNYGESSTPKYKSIDELAKEMRGKNKWMYPHSIL